MPFQTQPTTTLTCHMQLAHHFSHGSFAMVLVDKQSTHSFKRHLKKLKNGQHLRSGSHHGHCCLSTSRHRWGTLIRALSICLPIRVPCQHGQRDKSSQTALIDLCFYRGVLHIKILKKFYIDLCVIF